MEWATASATLEGCPTCCWLLLTFLRLLLLVRPVPGIIAGGKPLIEAITFHHHLVSGAPTLAQVISSTQRYHADTPGSTLQPRRCFPLPIRDWLTPQYLARQDRECRLFQQKWSMRPTHQSK